MSLSLALVLVALAACSGGQIDALKAQVARLQRQVTSLQQETESLHTDVANAQTAEEDVKACLYEVGGVVADLGGNIVYLGSTKIGAGKNDQFSAAYCDGDIMSRSDVRSIQRSVRRANVVVNRVEHDRKTGPMSPTTTITSTTGATARCNDGTLSYSQHASGTCSYHAAWTIGSTTRVDSR